MEQFSMEKALCLMMVAALSCAFLGCDKPEENSRQNAAAADSPSSEPTALEPDASTGGANGRPTNGEATSASPAPKLPFEVSEKVKPLHEVAVSPDGKLIASNRMDRYFMWTPMEEGVKIWDVAKRRPLHTLSTVGWPFAFSPNGETIAAIGYDKSSDESPSFVELFDVETGQRLDTKLREWRSRYAFTDVTFSPDGSKLLLRTHPEGFDRTRAYVLDVEKGQELFEWMREDKQSFDFAFAPDGDTLWVEEEGVLIQLDATSGKPLRKIAMPDDETGVVEIRPSMGKYVTTKGEGQPLEIRDMKSTEKLYSVLGGESYDRIEFSPDLRLIATIDEDKNLELRDGKSGEVIRTLTEDTSALLISFNANSKALVANADKVAERWDVDTGERIAVVDVQDDWLFFNAKGPLEASPEGAELIKPIREAKGGE